ncbi:MAG TPA: MBL fold metallo-hydrolase, partial [Bacteroidia bacterium]|nr:MBL fold metallo-hydrolase [Bacteroidia bacterium]
MKTKFPQFMLIVCWLAVAGSLLAQNPTESKLTRPATKFTKETNQKVLSELPFSNTQDFTDAKRGLLLPFNTMIDTNGNIVNSAKPAAWDMAQYAFENTNVNDTGLTVNPSLWREAQLNNFAGFFEVIPNKVYQVRGFDLSVMTLIMGQDKGTPCWIAIDPLVTAPTAKAGLGLANQWLTQNGQAARPVRAVIYTHSHIDHYGGVLGVTDTNAVNAGICRIYAPKAFLEHAVTENLMAGTAMGRRATYMYGNILFDKNPKSEVDAGLGKTTSSGPNNIIRPDTTDIIPGWSTIQHPARRTICGVNIDFWYTPETEAPAEMMFYFPDWKALCAAELVTHTMHNVYSLRGAAVRDALSWSGYINEVMETYGTTIEVLFASHHWPTWGNKNINGLLQKQRDLYKYLNDQTFRLFNQGYTMIEIGERVVLPDSLGKVWANRPYYGTV